MTIAIFGREIEREATGRLLTVLNALAREKAGLCYYSPFFKFLNDISSEDIPAGTVFSSGEDLPEDTSAILSIGGDGTFLSAVAVLKDRQIPIAGVNFGRLGFLTTVLPDKGMEWINDLLSGNYKVENRILLKAESALAPNDFYPYAVNEVSIQRKSPSMMSLNVTVDGKPLPVYRADGIVISTPTGSTAYNLSVGGPVVDPSAQVLIISPIAPHNLNVRPLIVSADSLIEVSFESRSNNSIISVDNRYFEAGQNGKVFVSKASFNFQYVSFSGNTFIEALKEKLLWGEDKRNYIKNV